MDMNLNVIKEPRGMIRIIQFLFAIFAFSSTTGFSTTTSMQTACAGNKFTAVIDYPVEYPFNFENIKVSAPMNCTREYPAITQRFPMDFSSNAQFFVATGVLCFLYTLAALVFYLFMHKNYETNPLLPMIDLGITGVLTIFWLAGSCAFAATLSDIKYYTHPNYLAKYIHLCRDKNAACGSVGVGKWSSLNIALIFGFANIFLWAASMWFVYKETHLHKQRMFSAVPGMPGMPGAQGMAGAPMGAPMAGGYSEPIGQQPMPGGQFQGQQQQQQGYTQAGY